MVERKKRRLKRDAISIESIKKLIKQGASGCLFFFIKNNLKTTRDDTILYVIENGRKNWGINLTMIQAISLRDKQSSISRAGVVRVFKTSTGKEFRVSQKAKRCLVCVVEAYILNIGRSAGRYADSANRSTIKIKDISNSLESLN